MQLTDDPKLLCEGGRVKDDVVAVCDRVSGDEKFDEGLGGGTDGVCQSLGDNDKVVSNVCVTQRGRGDVDCVRGESGEVRDQDGMLDLSDRQNGGGDEQAEGEGYADAHEGVYISVHGTGDEKGVLMPRCSMKSVAPSSAHGECTVQSHIQTPMGRTLLREGGFQREKLAGDSTFGQ